MSPHLKTLFSIPITLVGAEELVVPNFEILILISVFNINGYNKF